MKAVLIVNAHSRGGEKLFSKAVGLLQAKGIILQAAYKVRNPERIPEIVENALKTKPQLMIIGGGDGTISSVADLLIHQKVPLGILPLGTRNNFARAIGIPLSVKGAIDIISNGNILEADLGVINGDYFANSASIGFTADVVRSTPKVLKRVFGWLAYVWTALFVFFRHKAFYCAIHTGSRTYRVRTHQIIIANGKLFGGTVINGKAGPTSRRLTLVTMHMANRWHLIKMLFASALGIHSLFRGYHRFDAEKIEVATEPPQYVSLDGELTTRTPLTASLAKEILPLMVPKDYKG